MKRLISAILVICISLSCVSCLAEEPDSVLDKDGVLEKVGGFFSKLASDAGEALESAADNVGAFVESVREGIGDAATDAGQTVKAFWDNTAGTVKDTWDWAGAFAREKGDAVSEYARQSLLDLKTWISITGENAMEALHDAFNSVATGLGMAADSVARLWDSIQSYARENNISLPVILKLAIAIMIRIKFSRNTRLGKMAEKYIVETVMGWFFGFDIDDEESAESALGDLERSLDALPLAEN
ncbi:MAG: hypothetical protein IJI59_10825 [Clostridia bacterium]|nr:hypothetical protein [Clostridia bacterium]